MSEETTNESTEQTGTVSPVLVDPPLEYVPFIVVEEEEQENLDSFRLDSGSSMRNGVVTIVKRLYFKIPDSVKGTVLARQYCDIDVYSHENFPKMNSSLSRNAAFRFNGNCSISRSEDSRYFIAELEYSNGTGGMSGARATSYSGGVDIDGAQINESTPPWKLRPERISFDYPEVKVPMLYAYNELGNQVRVENSAGDRIIAERSVKTTRMSFSFCASKSNWNPSYALTYGNTINNSAITICGLTIAAKSAVMLPPRCEYLTTFNDDGTVKWEYWSVEINIDIDKTGLVLTQTFLDVGNRARNPSMTISDALGTHTLPASVYPEPVVAFRRYTNDSIQNARYIQNGDIVYATMSQFIAFREHCIAISNRIRNEDPAYIGGLLDPQCEQVMSVPLTQTATQAIPVGSIDTTAIFYQSYPTKTFRSYPFSEWSGMNLPTKGMNW